MSNIAIAEQNFLLSRCTCTGCTIDEKPRYDMADFDTEEEYLDYLQSEPSCSVCEDRGYYTDNMGHDNERTETCFCRVGFCGGLTEDDYRQDGTR